MRTTFAILALFANCSNALYTGGKYDKLNREYNLSFEYIFVIKYEK
jgi:hypothetical protein